MKCSGDGDMKTVPTLYHNIGILQLGDTMTRQQKVPDADSDAAPDKFEC